MENLDKKSLEEHLEEVSDLGSIAAKAQIRPVVAIVAKCTKILSKDLKDVSAKIGEFNDSTTRLTTVLIFLTAILAIATVILAFKDVLF